MRRRRSRRAAAAAAASAAAAAAAPARGWCGSSTFALLLTYSGCCCRYFKPFFRRSAAPVWEDIKAENERMSMDIPHGSMHAPPGSNGDAAATAAMEDDVARTVGVARRGSANYVGPE